MELIMVIYIYLGFEMLWHILQENQPYFYLRLEQSLWNKKLTLSCKGAKSEYL